MNRPRAGSAAWTVAAMLANCDSGTDSRARVATSRPHPFSFSLLDSKPRCVRTLETAISSVPTTATNERSPPRQGPPDRRRSALPRRRPAVQAVPHRLGLRHQWSEDSAWRDGRRSVDAPLGSLFDHRLVRWFEHVAHDPSLITLFRERFAECGTSVFAPPPWGNAAVASPGRIGAVKSQVVRFDTAAGAGPSRPLRCGWLSSSLMRRLLFQPVRPPLPTRLEGAARLHCRSDRFRRLQRLTAQPGVRCVQPRPVAQQ